MMKKLNSFFVTLQSLMGKNEKLYSIRDEYLLSYLVICLSIYNYSFF